MSLGDEATGTLVTDYRKRVAVAVGASKGIVLEEVGDSVLAVFRSAKDAVQAAAAVREALSDFPWPPGCDVALLIVMHSGHSVPQLRSLGERAIPDIDEPMRLYELVDSKE